MKKWPQRRSFAWSGMISKATSAPRSRTSRMRRTSWTWLWRARRARWPPTRSCSPPAAPSSDQFSGEILISTRSSTSRGSASQTSSPSWTSCTTGRSTSPRRISTPSSLWQRSSRLRDWLNHQQHQAKAIRPQQHQRATILAALLTPFVSSVPK